MLSQLTPEAKEIYAKEHLCIIQRDGFWYLTHCAPVNANHTAVNRKLVTAEIQLNNGDEIAACNKTATKFAVPFIVSLGE